jgi:GT2 family glycosyltransferase
MNSEVQTVAVIILTINQRERTLECLASLMAQEGTAFHAVVWDNGSQDGTVDAIMEAFPSVLVHHHSDNLGVASGRNAGAELAIQTFNPTHLLFLDNDMLFEAEFVCELLKPFANDDKLGQTQAKLRFLDDRQRLNDGGGAEINFVRWHVTPVGYGESDRGQHDTIKECIACGGAMMVRSDLFQRLGGFDPTFDPFGPEDLDFSLRLQKAGFRAVYVPQAVAYHAVSHTFGAGYSEDYARHKSRHWFTFMRRHASPIQQLGFFLFGAPYLAIRAMWREGRKGNLGALRGLVRGILDLSKPSLHTEGKE